MPAALGELAFFLHPWDSAHVNANSSSSDTCDSAGAGEGGDGCHSSRAWAHALRALPAGLRQQLTTISNTHSNSGGNGVPLSPETLLQYASHQCNHSTTPYKNLLNIFMIDRNTFQSLTVTHVSLYASSCVFLGTARSAWRSRRCTSACCSRSTRASPAQWTRPPPLLPIPTPTLAVRVRVRMMTPMRVKTCTATRTPTTASRPSAPVLLPQMALSSKLSTITATTTTTRARPWLAPRFPATAALVSLLLWARRGTPCVARASWTCSAILQSAHSQTAKVRGYRMIDSH